MKPFTVPAAAAILLAATSLVAAQTMPGNRGNAAAGPAMTGQPEAAMAARGASSMGAGNAATGPKNAKMAPKKMTAASRRGNAASGPKMMGTK
jgi:hypothetical protein